MSSKQCGVLTDGQYIEPQSGHDKITYECDCLVKGTQEIVWGFVLSDDREHPATPKLKESPPPVERLVTPRVKVVMQPRTAQPNSSPVAQIEVQSHSVGTRSRQPFQNPFELMPDPRPGSLNIAIEQLSPHQGLKIYPLAQQQAVSQQFQPH